MDIIKPESLPKTIEKYHDIGGILEFIFCEGIDNSDDSLMTMLQFALGDNADINTLRRLGYRKIDEKKFFGSWYDYENGLLVKCGEYKTQDGEKLINPHLIDLENIEIISGGFGVDDIKSGGNFAYAFSQPPYNLVARPFEIQDIFEKIRDIILPPYLDSVIYDWSTPELQNVSDYFEAGAEWWGVFLFGIYSNDLQRLVIIMGSATD